MLTPSEIHTVQKLLGKLKPGFLPAPIFYEIIRLVTNPTMMIVPIYQNANHEIFIWLHQREDNDPYYPGMLNPPGNVIRSTDASLEAVFKRIWTQEMYKTKIIKGPIFVHNDFTQTNRGKELTLLYWITINNQVSKGKLYPFKHLPSNIIESDRHRFQDAVNHFLKHEK